jgi:hypothetical protein
MVRNGAECDRFKQFVRSSDLGDLGALKTTKFYRINGGSTIRRGE